MSEENEALVREFFEGKTPREQMIDTVWAEKLAFHGREMGELSTRQEIKDLRSKFQSATVRNLKIEIERMFSNDEYVLAKLRMTGLEVDPDAPEDDPGKPITFTGMELLRSRDGQLVELWSIEGMPEHFDPNRARVD